MLDSAQPYSLLNQCKEDESYEAMVADGLTPGDPDATRGCGSYGTAVAFHLLF